MRTESLHILADALTPAENALLLKAVRVETRQRRPLLAGLGVGLSLALTCAAVWWIWSHLLPPKLIHWLALRDWSVVRVAMVVCSGVHAYVVLFAVASRNNRFFIQEAQQNALEQLLITPLSPAELLLRIAVHPFYSGMLLVLVGLPFYVFWALMGELTW